MIAKRIGKVGLFMEMIVSNPLRATVTVGTSIILLNGLIALLSKFLPGLFILSYIVPFIPPFFVTRIAKRITARNAQHDFVSDAEPFIFLAFPESPTKEHLLASLPDMVSDSTMGHFNCPPSEFLETPVLPTEFLKNPAQREIIAEKLLESLKENGTKGVLKHYSVEMLPRGSKTPFTYLMNSVLKANNGQLKWQGTMMRTAKEQ